MFVPVEPPKFSSPGHPSPAVGYEPGFGFFPPILESIPTGQIPVGAAGAAWTQVDASFEFAPNWETTSLDQLGPPADLQDAALLRCDPPESKIVHGPHSNRKQNEPVVCDSAANECFPAGTSVPVDSRQSSHATPPAASQLEAAYGSGAIRSVYGNYEFAEYPAPTSNSAKVAPWHWPRVVDELVSCQDDLISQLARTALTASRDETRRIMVTSPVRGSGKSTIAMTLAKWAAAHRQRVLLVDADFSRPMLAERLRLFVARDWRAAQDAFQKEIRSKRPGKSPSSETSTTLAFGFEQNLVHSINSPVSLLPLEPRVEDELTNRARMEQLLVLLTVAEEEFDCCIIDVGPIDDLLRQIDVPTKLASSVVVVNSMNSVSERELILACNRLWRCGNPALTIAENKSTAVPA